MSLFDMTGKVAVITGASGTFGRPSGKRSNGLREVYWIICSRVSLKTWAHAGHIRAIPAHAATAIFDMVIVIPYAFGSNQGVFGICALRATSSFISTPIPGRSGTAMWPRSMISPSFTQPFHKSRWLTQCHSQTRKFGTDAQTCAEAMVPTGETTQCGANGM